MMNVHGVRASSGHVRSITPFPAKGTEWSSHGRAFGLGGSPYRCATAPELHRTSPVIATIPRQDSSMAQDVVAYIGQHTIFGRLGRRRYPQSPLIRGGTWRQRLGCRPRGRRAEREAP